MLSPAKLDMIAVSCAFGNPGNQPGVSLTILHLSDLHFHALPRTFPEWASKRVLGAANLVLRRAQHYPLARAKALVEQVRALSWDHLVISGDLTQLALEQEFEQAREVLSPLLENPECVTVLPGNHDRYVAAAQFPEDRFQKHFGEFWTEGPLWAKALGEGWHLLGWDSTHPNDWWSACGTVPQATIAATERHLSTLPDNAKVLLANHYPLWFPEGWRVKPRHELHNLLTVRTWILRQPQLRAYLHGHVHRNWHLTIPRKGMPALEAVNSASSTEVLHSGKTSSFHRIVLDGEVLAVEPITF